MNEFDKSQAAKILACYNVTNKNTDLEKAQGFVLGQLDKSGRHVKTVDGWKSVKTHGHLINDTHQAPIISVPESPIHMPDDQFIVQQPVPFTPSPVIDSGKSLIEIRNEKNKKLCQIEERLDDHNQGLNSIDEDELVFLREKRKILQTVIQGLDKKIKTQKDDEIPEAIGEEVISEDPDAEPVNIAA